MTQRVQNLGAAYNAEPFDGHGVSLYVSTTGTVQYRNFRVLTGGTRRRRSGWIKGTSGNHDIASSVPKTTRVASTTDLTELTYSLPVGLASQDVTFDLRRYRDNVENESDNNRMQSVTLDASRDHVLSIDGTARLVSYEARSGGIVRLYIELTHALTGEEIATLTAARTAGPTSPTDASVTVAAGVRDIEIDTPALSDASAYTYKITASNAAATVTKDLLTGLSITADATGPTAPTNGIVEVV